MCRSQRKLLMCCVTSCTPPQCEVFTERPSLWPAPSYPSAVTCLFSSGPMGGTLHVCTLILPEAAYTFLYLWFQPCFLVHKQHAPLCFWRPLQGTTSFWSGNKVAIVKMWHCCNGILQVSFFSFIDTHTHTWRKTETLKQRNVVMFQVNEKAFSVWPLWAPLTQTHPTLISLSYQWHRQRTCSCMSVCVCAFFFLHTCRFIWPVRASRLQGHGYSLCVYVCYQVWCV